MDRQVRRISRRELLGGAVRGVFAEMAISMQANQGSILCPDPTPRRRRRLGRFVMEALEARRLLSVAPLNIPITLDPGVQQDPAIAVDPHDSSHLVVTYMD